MASISGIRVVLADGDGLHVAGMCNDESQGAVMTQNEVARRHVVDHGEMLSIVRVLWRCRWWTGILDADEGW